MSWFQRAVDEGVKQGIEKGVKQGVASAFAGFCEPGGRLDAIIEDVVWRQMEERISTGRTLTKVGFLWALKLCFHKHGCTRSEAHSLAVSTFRQYLADEKIKFGDPDYAWDQSGAHDVAEEYEFRHWEVAA